jgi:alpha-glucosidase (family GH31 glycosyl hydrolase)
MADFTAFLKRNNVHIVTTSGPGVHIPDTRGGEAAFPLYEEGLKKAGVFIPDPTGKAPFIGKSKMGLVHFPDFTHPLTEEWWRQHTADFFHKQLKMEGVSLHDNEPHS